MKRLLTILSIVCLSSCVKPHYDVSDVPGSSGKDDFAFQTKSSFALTINAVDGVGKSYPAMAFAVYGKNPYGENGERLDLVPLFIGLTDSNGKLDARFVVPNETTTLYVLPEGIGVGSMQTVNVDGTSANLTFEGTKPEYINTKTKSLLTKADEKIFPSIAIHPQTNTNVFTFYEGANGKYMGKSAYTNEKGDII